MAGLINTYNYQQTQAIHIQIDTFKILNLNKTDIILKRSRIVTYSKHQQQRPPDHQSTPANVIFYHAQHLRSFCF